MLKLQNGVSRGTLGQCQSQLQPILSVCVPAPHCQRGEGPCLPSEGPKVLDEMHRTGMGGVLGHVCKVLGLAPLEIPLILCLAP